MSNNLYADISPSLPEEFFETLAQSGNVRIERIVSHGHASPPGYWYDQDEAEFVVLLRGAARLRFEDEPQPIERIPGDYLTIAPHRRHRVEWATPAEATIWLAVHFVAR